MTHSTDDHNAFELMQRQIDQLRHRVELLEAGGAAVPKDGGGEPDGLGELSSITPESVDQAASESGLFIDAAMVSGVLAGALVLRNLTQRGILGPVSGVAVGMLYSLILLAAPAVVARTDAPRVRGTILAYCGLFLAFLMIGETRLNGYVGAVAGAGLAFGVAAVGIFYGIRRNQRVFTAFCFGVPLLLTPFMGPAADEIIVRGSGLVLLSGTAFVLAVRKGWRFLSYTVDPLCMLYLAIGVVTTSNRDYLPAYFPVVSLGAALSLYGLWCIRHFWLRPGAGPFFSLLHSTSTICILLAIYSRSSFATMIFGMGGTVLFLLAVYLKSKRQDGNPFGLGAFGVSAAICAGIGLPLFDGSGTLLAVVAVLFMLLARGLRKLSLLFITQLLLVVSCVVALGHGGLWRPENGNLWVATAGMTGAVASLSVYLISQLSSLRSLRGSWLAVISLETGLVMAYAAVRYVAFVLSPSEGARAMWGTVFLVGVSIGVSALPRITGGRVSRIMGVLCVLPLLAKVLLLDMMTLSAGYASVSVTLLMVTFAVMSALFRKIADPKSPETGSPEDNRS